MYWGTDVRRLARELPTLPAPQSVLLSILVLGLVYQSCTAQQPESPGKLPDAPSATAQGQSGKHNASIDLLTRQSRMFANLATNTAPLTAGEKFGLFAWNSVSLFTIVGSAAAAGIKQARNTQTGYDGLGGVQQLLWNIPPAIPFAPGPALLRAGHRELWL